MMNNRRKASRLVCFVSEILPPEEYTKLRITSLPPTIVLVIYSVLNAMAQRKNNVG